MKNKSDKILDAIMSESLEGLYQVFIEEKNDINTNMGHLETPVMISIVNNKEKSFLWLLEYGANLKKQMFLLVALFILPPILIV
jgi:hypothetical protein